MPIYRYKCEKCGYEEELILDLSKKKPERLDARAGHYEPNDGPPCAGTLVRKYDTFHFHISGR